MSKTNDGGAAFPTRLATPFGDGQLDMGGLTVRDWFAGQVLAGAAGRVDEFTEDELEKYAWRMADRMLAARNEQPTA